VTVSERLVAEEFARHRIGEVRAQEAWVDGVGEHLRVPDVGDPELLPIGLALLRFVELAGAIAHRGRLPDQLPGGVLQQLLGVRWKVVTPTLGVSVDAERDPDGPLALLLRLLRNLYPG
jgi:hypothetical protein